MSEANLENLSAREAHALVKAGQATLVDVREPAETRVMRAAGAVLAPLSTFRPDRLPAGRLVFICGSGKRSGTALARCAAAGLAHRAHVAGGMAAWVAAGLPVISG